MTQGSLLFQVGVLDSNISTHLLGLMTGKSPGLKFSTMALYYVLPVKMKEMVEMEQVPPVELLLYWMKVRN